MSFALADNQEKLQKSVNNLLPAVLQMLRSPQPPVQKKVSGRSPSSRSVYSSKGKVMEVLSHVSKRVKPDASISLPLDKLATQFLSADSSSLQKNFVLVYLQIGFSRAEVTVSGCKRGSDRPNHLEDQTGDPAPSDERSTQAS